MPDQRPNADASNQTPWSDRLVAAVIVGAAIWMVWTLVQIEPDARGHGTHEQLGMAVCSWPVQFGIPCPTCGCTTAASHLVHLSPLRALVVQPFGATLAAVALGVAAVALHSLVTARPFAERVATWPYGTATVAGIALFLLSWLYKYWTWPAG